jgi:hypothetical protein
MNSVEYLQLFVTRDVILLIMEETGEDVETAMTRFYTSPLFDKLQDPETGLYQESAGYVYDLFCDNNFNVNVNVTETNR